MAPDALRALLNKPEDNFIERKPAGLNRAEIRKTLSPYILLAQVGLQRYFS